MSMAAPLLGTRTQSQHSPLILSTRSPELSRHKRRRSDHAKRSLLRRVRYGIEDVGAWWTGRTRTRRALLTVVILGLLAYLLIGGGADASVMTAGVAVSGGVVAIILLLWLFVRRLPICLKCGIRSAMSTAQGS